MRKLILSLVFVLATGTSFMNASSSNKAAVNPSIEMIIEDGKASDCNWGARQLSLAISEDHSDRGSGGELMRNYKRFYAMCMKN
jgi:hypothetical protein